MKKAVLIIMMVVMIFSMGCAPGPNSAKDTADKNGQVAGFLTGCWHGFIMPLAFIATWFTDDVNIYEIHNNGVPYHFGLAFWGFITNLIIFIKLNSQ
jgi:hypothetical protein